jgi:hypothetical protein
MDNETPDLPAYKNTGMIAVGISLVILTLIVLQHNLSFKGTIVLPAGGTYLGPTETAAPAQPTAAPVQQQATTQGKFTVPANATWVAVYGNKYPYVFRAPKTLNLVTLPGEFDIYAISINNQPPDQNVLIGVDNLNRNDNLKQYVKGSKRAYVENWWKQFGLKGVSSISEFTNSNNLKGYRVKYLTATGVSPYDDIFFEVPDPQYVIHMSTSVLDPSLFNLIIDTVAWKK